jgi:hypothetical protein
VVADVRVDSVGKVDGRSACGQIHHIAFWCKYKNPLCKNIGAQRGLEIRVVIFVC